MALTSTPYTETGKYVLLKIQRVTVSRNGKSGIEPGQLCAQSAFRQSAIRHAPVLSTSVDVLKNSDIHSYKSYNTVLQFTNTQQSIKQVKPYDTP